MIGKIDKYEVLEELFVGSDTYVVKCRGQRDYAMKLLVLDQTSKQMVDRFKREMKIIATINHPNIIRGGDDCGLGRWRKKQCFYYLMEYVDGPSLRSLMETGFRFSEIDVLFIALETLKGLIFLKRRNIVHRDIKPSNILINKQCEIKIADLGLAKIVEHIDSHTQITMGPTILGTPYYLAPERTFHSDIDYIGDIYSLGATLYEMLTGFPPFRDKLGENPALGDFIDVLDKGKPPTAIKKINPQIPSNVASIVDSMLTLDKNKRPQHEKLMTSMSKIIQLFPRYPTDELIQGISSFVKKNVSSDIGTTFSTSTNIINSNNEEVVRVSENVRREERVSNVSSQENISHLEHFEFLKDTFVTLQRYRNMMYSLRVKEKLSREQKLALFNVFRDYALNQRDTEVFLFVAAITSIFTKSNIIVQIMQQKIPIDLGTLEKICSVFVRSVKFNQNQDTVKSFAYLHQDKQYTYINVLNDILTNKIANKGSIRATFMRMLVENELM